MKSKVEWVTVEIDLNNLPQMTPEELARIDAMADDEIDYSDIPGDLDWSKAVRGGIYKPK